MDCINKYSKKQQYSFGYKMGKIIKKLHNISTPTINENYTVEFIKKIDNYKNFFIQNKNNFDFLNYSLQEIEDVKYFIKKMPVIMIHNDFHLGNMIINKKDIKLIDFNRATYGNSIKEMVGKT